MVTSLAFFQIVSHSFVKVLLLANIASYHTMMIAVSNLLSNSLESSHQPKAS